MISVLQHQHVNKRRKFHLTSQNKQYERTHTITRTTSFARVPRTPKMNRYIIKTPVIFGIILFLLCLFISSPHIFSLTFKSYSHTSFQLPRESYLTDYPDGYDFVKNLTDEREYGIIKVSHNTPVQKENPEHYIVQKGDTVYNISKNYDISLYDLLRENRITDPTRLKIGDILTFPAASFKNTLLYNAQKSGALLPKDIEIAAQIKEGTAPFKVSIQIRTTMESQNSDPIRLGSLRDGITGTSTTETEQQNDMLTYMWVLGNDRYLFNKEIDYVYSTPGTYNVFLIISDKYNSEVVSNTLTIDVKQKPDRKLHIETKAQKYVTVNQINEIINLSSLTGLKKEELKNVAIKQTPANFQLIGDGQLLSIKAGYSKITIESENKRFISHLFVSPLPSKHSYEPPFDWYKTQFATGINGNCGPATVAMAIYWAMGLDIPVAKVRSEIGLPFRNGAIDFAHMFPSFRKHKVKAHYAYINNADDVRKIIDRGNIAIAVFNTRHISKTKGDPKTNMIGRHYSDNVGHYCVIKGFTLDGKYFIVYDPIPSDWSENSERYADGESMIGKNRFYLVSELYRSMGKKVIEISR
ncbi:MAG: LysM peptidoglycan-binding domain-containing protein [Spirochaetales bacterium]|nr:LysM peptidoglycan-binding domain-containing protein [Spirochaetales bacterium]